MDKLYAAMPLRATGSDKKQSTSCEIVPNNVRRPAKVVKLSQQY